MAERIVSPGVFTRERDLSFLPQAIGEIGAAIIGPTKKGPAFTPTQVSNFQDFEKMFGGTDNRFYTPHTVRQYLQSAGTVTIVRVLGIGGYRQDALQVFVHAATSVENGSGSGIPTATQSIAILAPSLGGTSGTADFSSTAITASNTPNALWGDFKLEVDGTNMSKETYELSFDTGSAISINKVISSSPLVEKGAGGTTNSVYLYKYFPHTAMNITASEHLSDLKVGFAVTGDGLDFQGGANSFDVNGNANSWTGNTDFQFARTPMIQSQKVSGDRHNLFRIYTRSHGTDMNTDFTVRILNVKPASDIPGSDFGTFSIQIVKLDTDETLLESFDNITLDPDSPNYLPRLIGDSWTQIDSNGKLNNYGNYPNVSSYIRIGDYNEMEIDGVFKLPKEVVPMGHKALNNPSPGGTRIPAAIYKTKQTTNNVDDIFDFKVPYGINLRDKHIKDNNMNYLAPIAFTATVGNNKSMSLEDMTGHDDASSLGATFANSSTKISLSNSAIQQRKFVVPFQWGFDGDNPAGAKLTGPNITSTNTQGFDCSTTTSSGSVAYKRAINAVSNPDEFDINLLATPGVIHRLHPTVTNHAISKVESRADAMFILDSVAMNDSIQTAKNTIVTLDSNYVATYYPWVQLVDEDTLKPIYVPPSVVLPGVISYTDAVAHEWFAPAGLNRGGLTSVRQPKTRLTHAERDDLYENRINPIAQFPGQGVVVFGQKTLQSKPSALDRINVRRLLIATRKFIASASRFLVFEQNSQALRNRFLNIVNPYLEQVQQNSGLSAFRVVMDDTNNTPDVVDRNQLVGQIFIQPTRTAEFIVLDFVVQPTGAAFPE